MDTSYVINELAIGLDASSTVHLPRPSVISISRWHLNMSAYTRPIAIYHVFNRSKIYKREI